MRWNIRFGLVIFLVRALVVVALAVSRDKVQDRHEGNLVSSFASLNLPAVHTRDERLHSASIPNSGFHLLEINTSDTDGVSETAPADRNQELFSSLEPRTLSKRASRALTHCPDPQFPNFDESVCLRNLSPQAYTVGCVHQFLYVGRQIEGHCAENEICVDGYRSPQQFHIRPPWNVHALPEVAYCVSTQDFVKIAQEKTGQVSSTTMGVHKVVGTTAGATMVEAVMTGLDSTTSVYAESLQIQAQTAETLHDTQTWRTLVNGSSECSNCSSIAIQPVPTGTDRIKVNVILEGAAAAGLLYLASIQSP